MTNIFVVTVRRSLVNIFLVVALSPSLPWCVCNVTTASDASCHAWSLDLGQAGERDHRARLDRRLDGWPDG
jgi:hypothetical protein